MQPTSYHGIHRGIIIANNDPEAMGRVKVFVPSVNLAMFSDWFEKIEGEGSKIFNGLGTNLNSSLSSDIMEKLHKYLPWSEVSQPMFGMGTSGSYSAPSKKTGKSECTEDNSNNTENTNIPITISSSAKETRKVFKDELNNASTKQRLINLTNAEVGIDASTETKTAFIETVVNRATVKGKSINSIISSTAYYASYGDGNYNEAAGNATSSSNQKTPQAIDNVLNGSNLTKGATDNASGGLASRESDSDKSSFVKFKNDDGSYETFYRKSGDKKLNYSNVDDSSNTSESSNPGSSITTTPQYVSSSSRCSSKTAEGSSYSSSEKNIQQPTGGGSNNNQSTLGTSQEANEEEEALPTNSSEINPSLFGDTTIS